VSKLTEILDNKLPVINIYLGDLLRIAMPLAQAAFPAYFAALKAGKFVESFDVTFPKYSAMVPDNVKEGLGATLNVVGTAAIDEIKVYKNPLKRGGSSTEWRTLWDLAAEPFSGFDQLPERFKSDGDGSQSYPFNAEAKKIFIEYYNQQRPAPQHLNYDGSLMNPPVNVDPNYEPPKSTNMTDFQKALIEKSNSISFFKLFVLKSFLLPDNNYAPMPTNWKRFFVFFKTTKVPNGDTNYSGMTVVLAGGDWGLDWLKIVYTIILPILVILAIIFRKKIFKLKK